MKWIRGFAGTITLCMMINACGSGQKSENPVKPASFGNHNFAALIRQFSQGAVANGPWAGYWWPYSQDGTAQAEALYDHVQSGAGAQDWELSHHGTALRDLQSWWGHCNGWAAATALFSEPRASKSVGGVTFSVADRKALLSEVAMEVTADFFGTRVTDPSDTSSLAFQDVFPDQFFLVFTNYIGQGYPVIIDRYTGYQVWNQPMAGYQMAPVTPDDYLGALPDAPRIFRINLTTTIWWLRDDVPGDHLTEPFTFADGPSYESRTLRYELWLDGPVQFNSAGAVVSSGDVVLARQGEYVTGGAWRNTDLELTNSHPDYLWIPHSLAPSSGFSNPKIDSGWVSHYLVN